MKKFDKAKKWVYDHEDEIIICGVIGTCFIGGVYVGRHSWTPTFKADKQLSNIISHLEKHPKGAVAFKCNNAQYFVITEAGLKDFGDAVRSLPIKG